MNEYHYILLFILALMGIVKCIILYGKYKIKQEKEALKYDIEHLNIKTIIYAWPITWDNYRKIEGYFDEMNSLPYKNREKTEILYNEFKLHYKELISPGKELKDSVS